MKLPEEISAKYDANITKEQRQHQVYILHLRGYKNQAVADELKVSVSTVEKDLRAIRDDIKQWVEEYKKVGRDNTFRDSFEQFDLILKEIWLKYHSEKDAKAQLKILDAISNTIVKFNLVMQGRRHI